MKKFDSTNPRHLMKRIEQKLREARTLASQLATSEEAISAEQNVGREVVRTLDGVINYVETN